MARAAAEPESLRGRLLFRVFAAGTIEDVERPETLEDILADYWKDIEARGSEKPEGPR
jgi:hypothetical protein